jgi:PAS domain S-box-containing protein
VLSFQVSTVFVSEKRIAMPDHQELECGGFDGIEAGVALSALIEDAGSAVLLMCRDLHYLAVNHVAARVVGKRPDEMVGRRLDDFFAPEVYENVRAVAHRVLDSGNPHTHYTIVRGMGWRTTMRPVRRRDAKGGPKDVVLLVSAPYNDLTMALWEGGPTPLSAQPDRTALPRLTERERKVLRLIGQGHSIDSVAKLMFRSVKTIESIRTSLTKKVGAKSRIDLARIAMLLGPVYDVMPLLPDDSRADEHAGKPPCGCD